MALLSKSCVYGIRAALFISATDEKRFVSIRVMAEELSISFHFLTKVLQTLTHEGILRSSRGPKGGVQLARPASEITLRDVLVAIEDPELFSSCILGLPGCSDKRPCPLHAEWAPKRGQLEDMFSAVTLDQVGEGLRTSAFRINESGEISFTTMESPPSSPSS